MTPAPTLTELIHVIRSDSPGPDPLDELATASLMVSAMGEASDSALGFFVDQCRRRGHSWTEISAALGVTKQAAHKRFMPVAPALDRYTSRAQAARREATEAAMTLGHNYVGTEHLLLGLFEPAGGVAAQVLTEAGITRSGVVEQVAQRVPGPVVGVAVSTPPYTPRATQCLGRALTEALSMGHDYIGTEHLLLALFGDAGGLAGKILGDLGLDRDEARSRIIAKLVRVRR